MAKSNFKDLLIAKGEKIALGIAAGGLGLLGIWGIVTAISADNPSAKVAEFKSGGENLQRKISNDTGETKPLEPWVSSKVSFKPVDSDDFVVKPDLFEPVEIPSKLRENPIVLGISDSQIDLVRLPMKAYDLRINEQTREVSIGILKTAAKISETDSKKILANLKSNDPKTRASGRKLPPRPPATPPSVPGAPPAGGRGIGGAPPGASGPGGFSGSGTGGYGSGVGDVGGFQASGGGLNGYDSNSSRLEQTVDYVSLDAYKPATDVPAFIIYPRRTILLHATFPLKEQLEIVRRACRLRTIEEASRETTTPPATNGPTFAGFEVERRVTLSNGQELNWEPYDHVASYLNTIHNRKISDQPDDGYLAYFLRYEQEMATPLPTVAEGQQVYPEIRMRAIYDTVEKLKAAQKPVYTPSQLQNKFAGLSANPFIPSPAAGGAAGAGGGGGDIASFYGGTGQGPGVSSAGVGGGPAGLPGGSGGFPGGFPGAPSGLQGSGGQSSSGGESGFGSSGSAGRGFPGGYNPNGFAGAGLRNFQAPVELEYMMIRFMDVDVLPGYTYQYRIRVKMRNPNYRRTDVGRAADAQIEVIPGAWATIATRVTVPSDVNMYVVDPVDYSNRINQTYKDRAVVNLLDNKNGTLPVVQLQTWMQQVRIDTKREPVGAWVIADVPVNRGEFIGKKQLVSLPLWSAQKVKFLLQEIPKYRVKNAKEQPKGMLVDFTTSMLCVDYEGGKSQRFNDRTYEDEAPVEMLILRSDGSVFVRNSADDMVDPEREKREKEWNAWIDRVKADTAAVGPLGGPSSGGDFGKGGS